MGKDRPASPEPSHGWKRRAAFEALAVILLALTFGATASLATDLGPEPQRDFSSAPQSQWQLEVTPYSWLINLDGELEFGAIRQDVYYTFFDILEDTESPYEIDGAVELKNGPFPFSPASISSA